MYVCQGLPLTYQNKYELIKNATSGGSGQRHLFDRRHTIVEITTCEYYHLVMRC